MASQRVLVTGAAGLIGAAVCRRLTGDSVPFTAVWREVEPAAADKVQADLAEPGALAGIEGIGAVVHAAAVLPASFEDSERAAELNFRIDDNVLHRARAWGARVVYISGTSLYRSRGDEPLDESAELAPVGPYLEEKARTEEIGLAQAAESGVPFTALRVSAPYGPGQRVRTVIQRFVDRAIAGEPLEYYGTGSREQDFTWADDVADAIALALNGPGGVFNVASGRPVTMRALALTIAAAARRPADSVRAAGRPDPQEGAMARFAVGAAARELGWSASTPLAVGVERLLGAGR